VTDYQLEQQLAAAVRSAMAEAAGYLALVTRTNPRGSADALLRRPDTDAVLSGALDEAREAAAEAVRQAWYASADAPAETPMLRWLLDDIDRIFGNLAHLRGLVRHAHASVSGEPFTRGVHAPGEHPSQRAAERRADAVRDTLLAWGGTAAVRARMAVSTAGGAGQTAAVLAVAERQAAAGERLMKQWKAHTESPSCCHWCRRLNGVTIGLRASFAPYLGGPVPLPRESYRYVRTEAGERRYGLPAGSPVAHVNPPRPYHGELQGPLLHPFCRCRLVIVRAGSHEAAAEPIGEPARFVSAADVRDMPDDSYQATRAFLQAAAHELDQVLKRLAGSGG